MSEEVDLDPEAPNRMIAEWCKNAGIEVVDLLPALKKAGLKNPHLYYPVNRHWTPDGHQVVAETLLPILIGAQTP